MTNPPSETDRARIQVLEAEVARLTKKLAEATAHIEKHHEKERRERFDRIRDLRMG